MGNKEKLGELREKLENMRKELRIVGESATKDALKDFFDSYPQVEAVRWLQYTPFFNDGDTCEFNVHEPLVKLEGVSDDEEGGWTSGEEGGYLSAYSIEKVVPAELRDEYNKLIYPPDGKEVTTDKKYGYGTESNFSQEGYSKGAKLKTWAAGANQELKNDLGELGALLSEAEESMQAAFGDHARITATRDGIEVDEYEHD
jgi:hypothetical protein